MERGRPGDMERGRPGEGEDQRLLKGIVRAAPVNAAAAVLLRMNSRRFIVDSINECAKLNIFIFIALRKFLCDPLRILCVTLRNSSQRL